MLGVHSKYRMLFFMLLFFFSRPIFLLLPTTRRILRYIFFVHSYRLPLFVPLLFVIDGSQRN